MSADSARELEQLATRLWRDVLAAMVEAAVPLCEKDEPAGGDQRIRLGMFCYAAPMNSTPAEGARPTAGAPDDEDSPR